MEDCRLVKKLFKMGIIDVYTEVDLINNAPQIGCIVVKKTKGNITTITKADRGDFYVAMNHLKKTYYNNNEVSKQLVDIAHNLEMITIFEDRYDEMDIPKIYCQKLDGTVVGIEVRKTHKIIWELLQEM